LRNLVDPPKSAFFVGLAHIPFGAEQVLIPPRSDTLPDGLSLTERSGQTKMPDEHRFAGSEET
jgi:hypothetical protein